MQQAYASSNPYNPVSFYNDVGDSSSSPVQNEAPIRSEEHEKKSTPPVEDDKNAQFSLGTKIHLGVGLTACILCFLVWHYISENPQTAFWWWIYPFFFFAMTITAQIHYQSQQYWRGVVLIVGLANFMIFLTDGLTALSFPQWWIFPAGVSGMALLGVYAWRYPEEFSPLTTAFYEYCILNVLLFLAWLIYAKEFPWWIIPMFILAIPLIIVYMRVNYAEYRVWLYVCVALVVLDVMFFLIWGFVLSGFPWFLVIWVVSAVVIVLLVWKFRGQPTYEMQVEKGKIASEDPMKEPV